MVHAVVFAAAFMPVGAAAFFDMGPMRRAWHVLLGDPGERNFVISGRIGSCETSFRVAQNRWTEPDYNVECAHLRDEIESLDLTLSELGGDRAAYLLLVCDGSRNDWRVTVDGVEGVLDLGGRSGDSRRIASYLARAGCGSRLVDSRGINDGEGLRARSVEFGQSGIYEWPPLVRAGVTVNIMLTLLWTGFAVVRRWVSPRVWAADVSDGRVARGQTTAWQRRARNG